MALKKDSLSGKKPTLSPDESFFEQCFNFNTAAEPADEHTWPETGDLKGIPDLIKNDRLSDALSAIERHESDFPDLDYMYAWKSHIFQKQGDLEKAESILEQGLARSNRKFVICDRIGFLAYHRDDIREAVKWWIRSIILMEQSGTTSLWEPFLFLACVARASDLNGPHRQLMDRVKRICVHGELDLDPPATEKLTQAVKKLQDPAVAQAIIRLCETCFGAKQTNADPEIEKPEAKIPKISDVEIPKGHPSERKIPEIKIPTSSPPEQETLDKKRGRDWKQWIIRIRPFKKLSPAQRNMITGILIIVLTVILAVLSIWWIFSDPPADPASQGPKQMTAAQSEKTPPVVPQAPSKPMPEADPETTPNSGSPATVPGNPTVSVSPQEHLTTDPPSVSSMPPATNPDQPTEPGRKTRRPGLKSKAKSPSADLRSKNSDAD